ncbi:hypothetical protein STEG23_032011 [Scotinomys teguina]
MMKIRPLVGGALDEKKYVYCVQHGSCHPQDYLDLSPLQVTLCGKDSHGQCHQSDSKSNSALPCDWKSSQKSFPVSSQPSVLPTTHVIDGAYSFDFPLTFIKSGAFVLPMER